MSIPYYCIGCGENLTPSDEICPFCGQEATQIDEVGLRFALEDMDLPDGAYFGMASELGIEP